MADNKTWLDLTLLETLAEYKDSSENEPLDIDEVERLVNIIRLKLNLHEGNITQEEYDNQIDWL